MNFEWRSMKSGLFIIESLLYNGRLVGDVMLSTRYYYMLEGGDSFSEYYDNVNECKRALLQHVLSIFNSCKVIGIWEGMVMYEF